MMMMSMTSLHIGLTLDDVLSRVAQVMHRDPSCANGRCEVLAVFVPEPQRTAINTVFEERQHELHVELIAVGGMRNCDLDH